MECLFCHDGPVYDAAEWLDGVRRSPAPCPRCGKVYEPDENPSYGPGNPDWERDFERTRQ